MYAKAVAEFKGTFDSSTPSLSRYVSPTPHTVTWQKQRKEKERKFMKAAQAELNEHVRALVICRRDVFIVSFIGQVERKEDEVKAIMRDM